jgi:hypothetical protein
MLPVDVWVSLDTTIYGLVSSLTFVALGLAWPFDVSAGACSLFVLFIGCMLLFVLLDSWPTAWLYLVLISLGVCSLFVFSVFISIHLYGLVG